MNLGSFSVRLIKPFRYAIGGLAFFLPHRTANNTKWSVSVFGSAQDEPRPQVKAGSTPLITGGSNSEARIRQLYFSFKQMLVLVYFNFLF